MGKIRFDELLFKLHILVFSSLILIFFIPLSVWPERTAFHFWYITLVLASEIITGSMLLPHMIKHKRYRIVCPLTTWMQYVRGYSPKDPKNFDYSFVKEFGEKMNIYVPKGAVSITNFAILIIAAMHYFG